MKDCLKWLRFYWCLISLTILLGTLCSLFPSQFIPQRDAEIHIDISSVDFVCNYETLPSFPRYHTPQGHKGHCNCRILRAWFVLFPLLRMRGAVSLLSSAPQRLAFFVMTSPQFFSHISGPLRIYLWSYPFFSPLISWFFPEFRVRDFKAFISFQSFS